MEIKQRDILIFLSVKYEGDWDRIMSAIRRKENIPFEDILPTCAKVNSKVTTILDEDYPEALKHAPKPPLVLYYYGDLGLVSDYYRCISYVGSREPTSYGIKSAKEIVNGLAKDSKYVIVSGLARGIDTIATQAAIEAGGKAVAVLGSGIDRCYPSSNQETYDILKNNGLIISEYPFGCEPSKERLPFRNRIVAALSSTLVVGEARSKSGTMITVSFALMMGRNVCCVPFHADEGSVCNTFIKDGAFLVESPEDVDLVATRPKLQR